MDASPLHCSQSLNTPQTPLAAHPSLGNTKLVSPGAAVTLQRDWDGREGPAQGRGVSRWPKDAGGEEAVGTREAMASGTQLPISPHLHGHSQALPSLSQSQMFKVTLI